MYQHQVNYIMLLVNNALLTWRLDNKPEELHDRITEGVKIVDHDLRFLSYEGAVNNGAGSVEIAAKGVCLLHIVSEQEIEIEFDSSNLAGQFKLHSIDGDKWQLRSLA